MSIPAFMQGGTCAASMSLLCWQHWPQSHSIRPHRQSHAHTHMHTQKRTQPGPRASSRTIFILAHKTEQRSSVSLWCMLVCFYVCLCFSNCSRGGWMCFDHTVSTIGKSPLRRREHYQTVYVKKSRICGAFVNLFPPLIKEELKVLMVRTYCVRVYDQWLFFLCTFTWRPCVIRSFIARLKDDSIFNQLSPSALHSVHYATYTDSRLTDCQNTASLNTSAATQEAGIN